MTIRWGRAVAASVLSLGCVTLAFMPAGLASAGTTPLRTVPVLTWSQPKPTGVSSGADIGSVSCPSVKFCAAVDHYSEALAFNGTRWSAPVIMGPSGNPLASVSCPSAKFCVAVSEVVDVSYYNGRAWSAPKPAGNTGAINGHSWSAPVAIGEFLTAVSCPSTRFCAAVDSSGSIVGYNGKTWTSPVTIDRTSILAILTPGAAKGTVRNIDPDPGAGLEAVSCASTAFCVATDQAGNYVVGR